MTDVSHPPMDQLQDLEYCIDSNPPWGETILIALQNYILVLGTSVMIPTLLVRLMGGNQGDIVHVIQNLLFVGGTNTFLQSLFGTRLPTVIGGPFAYVIPIIYIISDSSLQRMDKPQQTLIQTMRAIQGALIVAASIQIIIGYSQIRGLFSGFFSPLGMEPVVGLVGLPYFNEGFPRFFMNMLGNYVEIGLPMLLLVISLPQYLNHIKPLRDFLIFERFPVLICVTIVWIYLLILTASGVYHGKPIKLRSVDLDCVKCDFDSSTYVFLHHLKVYFSVFKVQVSISSTFSAGHSIATMSSVLVSMVESTGAYKAASRMAIATPPPAYVLSRGIGWQRIGILLNGLYGTLTGSTISVESVGLLQLARVGSRRVIQIPTGFMIFFSILGKFGAVFASIPFPIYAALYCVLFSVVGSVGLLFLQFTNMNSTRNLFMTGLSLFLGISIPHFFGNIGVHINAGWFNAFLNTIFSSPPTVGLILTTYWRLWRCEWKIDFHSKSRLGEKSRPVNEGKADEPKYSHKLLKLKHNITPLLKIWIC
ncbi:nucleobase-ascorbate transporter 1-like [Olea europaea var. sylvestris]|uniref:nucleobase-ascorbate transporter 1-like n=1 Tax=Olea europaea var. sylvestris TaxID=158386 RepID=UPI000C1D4182|nr:nucleobase-ascorbate transporter 1-like [Olea europaea var. sylvestris]